MDVLGWLLDGDPAIRWQVMRDLLDEPADVVVVERARVVREGWGARMLALRGPDGLWEGGALFPARDGVPLPWRREDGQPWTATAYSLQLLVDMGADPSDTVMAGVVDDVRARARWEHDGQPFFEGEVEPCINGQVVGLGAALGVDVRPVVERLLGEQLEDGGWNCEAENGSVRSSFHTTIRVLEGLLAFEQAGGGGAEVTAVRRRGEAYLLDRRLLYRRSTGALVDPDVARFAWPTRWHYDALRGLEHFRATGDAPDPRLADALSLVREKRQPDGRWLLDHAWKGATHFPVDDGVGLPSRWNTLRALRVLRWADGGATP